jgi:hypothetical protein
MLKALTPSSILSVAKYPQKSTEGPRFIASPETAWT